MRKTLWIVSMLIVASLVLAACGGAPASTGVEPVTVVETVIVEVPGETIITQPQGYGTILARVKERGKLVCGGRTDLLGFGYLDDNGNNVGFDTDLCRAVAAAVLGDPTAVEFVPLTAADRGPALQTGEVDLLSRNVTWNSKRDAEWGNFTVTMFYDGQTFIVGSDSGINTLKDMDGATVCVTTGTTTEKNLASAFADAGLTYEAVTFEDTASVYSAYDEGRCDVATSDASQLAAIRVGLQDPAAHKLLGFTISKEYLTPAVPAGDDQWFDLVKTVMWSLITAEEFGITSANVEEMKSSQNGDVRALLGVEGDWGYTQLGVDASALANAITAVGNYGEIYNRYFGADGVFVLDRGPNNLGINGGWLVAPAIK
ncbi:MAG: amino acid ABC transporter substrate-binding protein [Anaerolineales bacterium]|nr:amino acid ABC transporter substrate-binding protein [Anaerolineales bacterium]MDP2776473.1 amino acid ABC transporter substrate-binding protein [Anaerolineales bacterium]